MYILFLISITLLYLHVVHSLENVQIENRESYVQRIENNINLKLKKNKYGLVMLSW